MNDKLKKMLFRHEGNRPDLYVCPTGHKSIGVGHNCEAHPLPPDIQEYLDANGFILQSHICTLFRQDVVMAQDSCRHLYPCFDEFSENRRNALTDFLFNVGEGTAKGFRRTNRAINDGRWEDAATYILQSKYARQVGERAQEISELLRYG